MMLTARTMIVTEDREEENMKNNTPYICIPMNNDMTRVIMQGEDGNFLARTYMVSGNDIEWDNPIEGTSRIISASDLYDISQMSLNRIFEEKQIENTAGDFLRLADDRDIDLEQEEAEVLAKLYHEKYLDCNAAFNDTVYEMLKNKEELLGRER